MEGTEQLHERTPQVPPATEPTLKLQPDGSVKGLGEVMKGLFTVDPKTEAPGPAEAAPVEATPSTEAPTSEPAPTPTPEAKRKLKWNGQEVEVPEKEIEALAQQGFDYTKKTQALAERERSLAPVEGLAKQIQADPRFAAHVYGYFNQQVAPAHPPAAPTPPPTDPIDRLKWEIRQDVMQDINKVKQEFTQAVAPLNQQSVITRTMLEVQKDPMYNEVQGKLFEYVNGLPPHSKRLEYMRLDQDPQSYTEMYDHFRTQLVRAKESTAPTQTPAPAPTTRETKAPMLEASGPSSPPPSKDSVRKEKITKAKARLLAGGDINALADWIRESGVSEILKNPSPT